MMFPGSSGDGYSYKYPSPLYDAPTSNSDWPNDILNFFVHVAKHP